MTEPLKKHFVNGQQVKSCSEEMLPSFNAHALRFSSKVGRMMEGFGGVKLNEGWKVEFHLTSGSRLADKLSTSNTTTLFSFSQLWWSQ